MESYDWFKYHECLFTRRLRSIPQRLLFLMYSFLYISVDANWSLTLWCSWVKQAILKSIWTTTWWSSLRTLMPLLFALALCFAWSLNCLWECLTATLNSILQNQNLQLTSRRLESSRHFSSCCSFFVYVCFQFISLKNHRSMESKKLICGLSAHFVTVPFEWRTSSTLLKNYRKWPEKC